MKKVRSDFKKFTKAATLKFAISIVLLFAFSEFSNAQITSNFNTDNEGWTFSDQNLNQQTVNYSSTGGNPGGHITSTIGGQVYYWTSPSKFNGNITYFSYGQILSFDLQNPVTPTIHGLFGYDVAIRLPGGGELVHTLPTLPAVAPAWSTHTVRLDETTEWRIGSPVGPIATKAQIMQYLSNVASLRINGKFVSTGSGASASLDNVRLEQRTIQTAPGITTFTPTSGKPGSSITINGSGFSSTLSQNAAYFGSIAGVITNASATQLTVTVPVGATYGAITILNKTNGLTTQTKTPFTPTFDNGGRIIPASFYPKVDILSTVQCGGLTLADIDGDGWNDIIMANEDNSGVEVHRNLGLGGSVIASSFATKITFPTNKFGTNGAGLRVVDLDGDGKLDLVTSAWNGAGFGGGIFVTFRNISTVGNVAFEAAEDWLGISDESPIHGVADIDGDGLPELISGEGNFWIAQNMSIIGNIQFGPSLTYLGGTIFGAVSNVNDLDNDGKSELIIVNGSNLTVVKNNSTPGVISFGSSFTFAHGGSSGGGAGGSGGIQVADFNEDGKNDLAWKNGNANDDVHVRLNTNSGGALAATDFATEVILDAEIYNYGSISLSDINGDGKVDILATDGVGDFCVFENIYSGGAFSSNSFIKAFKISGNLPPTTAYNYPYNIIAGDLNGDAKPEIIFANTNANTVSYRINIIENKNVHAPVISLTTVSPLTGVVGSTVTITGDHFSTTLTDNQVYFGTVKATVLTATKIQLTVTVPAGAQYAPVSVTRDRLTSTYHLPFTVTFSPGTTFDGSTFSAPIAFNLTSAYYEVLTGDLNSDGKPDVIATGGTFDAYAFKNTHNSGSISASSLIADDTLDTFGFSHLPSLQDFDGDGKTDLMVHEGYIYKNLSTPSEIDFTTSPSFEFYSLNHSYGDFDHDGKTDFVGTRFSESKIIVTTNKTTTGPFVFFNGVQADFASFDIGAMAVSFTKPAVFGYTAAADFNNDGWTDIVATNSATDNFTVWKNNQTNRISTSSFTNIGDIGTGVNPVRVYTSDLDVDGKVDLMIYYGGGASSGIISIFRNTSASGGISFDRQDFTIGSNGGASAIGDLDGDGKPEIVVPSEAANVFRIFKNNTTAGVINATSFTVSPAFAVTAPRAVAIGDLNLDGKPEIIITSAPNSLLVFENLVPTGPSIVINPQPASTGICEGTTTSFTLTATGANNLTYQWQKFDGSIFNNITNTGGYTGTTTSTLSINTAGNFGAGDYRCRVSGDLATDKFSNTVTLTINAVPATPITTGAINCIAAAITLNASGGTNGQYRWYDAATGGTAISGQVNSSYTTPVISTTTTYYASINNGSCESSRAPAIATIAPLAKPSLTTSVQAVSGVINICTGDVLTITAPSGFTDYTWSNGATSNPITISTSTSSLTLQVTDGAGCVSPFTDALNVVVNPYPTATITVNDTQLTASAGDSYQWYQNGNTILGATNQYFVFNFLEYGLYKVDVTENGCKSTSSEFEYLITDVENLNTALKLFPNPIDENLFVEFNPPYTLSVMDVTGKAVYKTNVDNKSATIDLTTLATGIYFLQIQNEKRIHLIRIFKQ